VVVFRQFQCPTTPCASGYRGLVPLE